MSKAEAVAPDEIWLDQGLWFRREEFANGPSEFAIKYVLASQVAAQLEERERQARSDTLEFLNSAVDGLGFEDGARLTIGHLQAQLGMTKPFSEVRKDIGVDRKPTAETGDRK